MAELPSPVRQPVIGDAGPTAGAPAYGGIPAGLDRFLHNWQSHFTAGRSPSTLSLAFLDWAAHAANSPFQTAMFWQTALVQWQRLAQAAMGGEKAIAPQPDDRRFAHPAWQTPPTTCSPRRYSSGRNGGTALCAVPAGSGSTIKTSSHSLCGNGSI